MSRAEAQNPYVLPIHQMGFCADVLKGFQREVTLGSSFESEGLLPTQTSSVWPKEARTTGAEMHAAADLGQGNATSS